MLTGRKAIIPGLGFILISCLEIILVIAGPLAFEEFGLQDVPFCILVFATLYLGFRLLLPKLQFQRNSIGRLYFFTEVLSSYSLLLFLFAFIYAANVGMDYVQRFIESGGDLRLAIDTSTERAIVAIRYLPFLLSVFLLHLYLAVRLRRYGLLLTFLAVGLSVLSFPSIVSLERIGILGWIALTPLLYLLWKSSYGNILFYGIFYGVLTTILSNYWLGTFSLVSLQAVVVIFFVFYLIFMLLFGGIITLLRRSSPGMRILITASAWTIFELFRSSGFLGYPWVLTAHSQHGNLPLIQISEFTGVWGVTFVLVLVNCAAAELIYHTIRFFRERYRLNRSYFFSSSLVSALAFVLVVTVGAHLYGGIVLLQENRYPDPDAVVRAVLIQQNSDPRKHDYERTFESLKRLSKEAVDKNPDIIVWPETAFVPNIRRWGEEDPDRFYLARLVRDFRDFQRSLGIWLLTGNDDYELELNESGEEVDRHHYNASVLFSDEGQRMETYHKIKLVPFTEYFPYQRTFPRVHRWLQAFDVTFWEPGDERTVFHHPKFSFSTPICFEDVFPHQIRQFIPADAGVILNLTNDYWSLTEVQAKQHFVASLFRAVENRRPLLRATVSGVTAHVDPYGRIRATLPQYSEEYLVVDVPVSHTLVFTAYTRFGDWFPGFSGLLVLVLSAGALFLRLRRVGLSG